jgi:heptosyltransferase-2
MRAMPGVAEVLEFSNRHGKLDLPGRWRMARRLAARRYDRAYVLPNSFKSAIVPFLAGIRQRDRLARRSPAPAAERAARRPRRRHATPADGRALRAARDAARAAAARAAAQPGVAGRRGRVRETLDRLSLADGPLVVMAPGAEYGPAKRWPPRHFAALANMVADEWPEASIALLGSAKERALATEIAALSGLTLRNLCGETSLDEAIALVSHAAGVVSNDSGPHARGRRARPAAGGVVRLDRSAPHRAALGARPGAVAAPRVQPVLRARMPARPPRLPERPRPAGAFSALRQTMRIETATRR